MGQVHVCTCRIAVQLYQTLGRYIHPCSSFFFHFIRYGTGTYIHPCSIAIQLYQIRDGYGIHPGSIVVELYQIWGKFEHTSLQLCCTTLSDVGWVCAYTIAALWYNYIIFEAGMYIHPCSIAVELYQTWGRYSD